MVAEVPGVSPITLGADKGYYTTDFVADPREIGVTPHVAQNDRDRSSAVDQRNVRHSGYDISQRKRKRVGEIFGWIKTVGCPRKTRHHGRERVGWVYLFTLAAYDLVRIERLVRATG